MRVQKWNGWGKRLLAIPLVAALLLAPGVEPERAAARVPMLNQKTYKMLVGMSVRVRLMYTNKYVSWSVISGIKNLELTSYRKNSVRLVARRTGKAKVQAKVGKNKYICKVSILTAANAAEPKETTIPTPYVPEG